MHVCSQLFDTRQMPHTQLAQIRVMQAMAPWSHHARYNHNIILCGVSSRVSEIMAHEWDLGFTCTKHRQRIRLRSFWRLEGMMGFSGPGKSSSKHELAMQWNSCCHIRVVALYCRRVQLEMFKLLLLVSITAEPRDTPVCDT